MIYKKCALLLAFFVVVAFASPMDTASLEELLKEFNVEDEIRLVVVDDTLLRVVFGQEFYDYMIEVISDEMSDQTFVQQLTEMFYPFSKFGFLRIDIAIGPKTFRNLEIPSQKSERYLRAESKAIASEFPTMLSQIRAAEEVNMAEVGEYVAAANAKELRENLGIEVRGDNYFSYKIECKNPQSFLATATVVKSFGNIKVGESTWVDQDGKKGVSKGSGLEALMEAWFTY